jgi:hypothetical protein
MSLTWWDAIIPGIVATVAWVTGRYFYRRSLHKKAKPAAPNGAYVVLKAPDGIEIKILAAHVKFEETGACNVSLEWMEYPKNGQEVKP